MGDVSYSNFRDKIKKGLILKNEQRIYIVGGVFVVLTVWIWSFYSIISGVEKFKSMSYTFLLAVIFLAEFAVIGICGIIYNKRKQTRTKEEELFFSKYWVKKLIRECIIAVVLLIGMHFVSTILLNKYS